MIWHLYDNNEKYIMTDSPHQTTNQSSVTFDNSTDESSSTCSEETETFALKKPYVSPNSKSLFLNFAPDLNAKPSKASANKTKKSSARKSASVKVSGVNILNRKDLDSKTIADRIQKRRENHNNLERRRRDCINKTIIEISQVLPNSCLPDGQRLNKSSILKSALSYIMSLQTENEYIKRTSLGDRQSV